jgi:hypothetical protein
MTPQKAVLEAAIKLANIKVTRLSTYPSDGEFLALLKDAEDLIRIFDRVLQAIGEHAAEHSFEVHAADWTNRVHDTMCDNCLYQLEDAANRVAEDREMLRDHPKAAAI